MSPMFTLLLGIVAFIALIVAGFINEWPFGAGLLLMAGACLATVGWLYWYAFGEVKP